VARETKPSLSGFENDCSVIIYRPQISGKIPSAGFACMTNEKRIGNADCGMRNVD
jgi:hypothetical protein